MRSLVSLLGALGLTLSLSTTARGQVVWTGLGIGPDSNAWSTGANWVDNANHANDGIAPATDGTATVQFAGSTPISSPFVDHSGWSIAGLAFNSDAVAFTLNGDPLTIGSGGITNNSTNPQIVYNYVILGAAQTLSASAGDLTVGGSNTVDNGGFTLTADAALGMTLTFPRSIYGQGGLTKTGAGSVYIGYSINDGDPITGAVQVLEGTLSIHGELNTSGRLTVASAANFQTNTNGLSSSVGSLAGGGALTLNGELVVGSDNTSTEFSGTINDGNGSASVTKTGAGTLTLSGTNTYTYTGSTTVNGGTLSLDFSSLNDPTTGLISSSSDLVLGGGTLSVLGGTTGISNQAFAGTTLNPGASAIAVNSTGVDATNLNLGLITRNAGATVDFTLPVLGNIKTTSGNPNGILGGWATVTNAEGTVDWATVSSGNIVAASYTNGAWAPGHNTNNTNVTIDSMLSADSTTNSLRFDTSSATTINLSSFNGTITSGGILVTPTVGGYETLITGGTLQASSGNDLVVIQNNPSGSLAITSNIVGDSGLTKSGAGLLALSGANLYTGGTTINAGVLSIGADSALGNISNGVTFNGGTLQTNNNASPATYGRAITLLNNGGTIDVYGNTSKFTGAITGSGALTVADSSGGGTLTLSYANNYSGGTLVDGINGSVTLIAGAVGVFGTGPMTVNGNGNDTDNTATLDLNSHDQTFASLTGDGYGIVNLNGAKLTLTTGYGSNPEFQGQITGSGALVKDGAGTFTLSASNSYAGYNNFVGSVSINAGTLTIYDDSDLGNATNGLTFNGGTLQTYNGVTSARSITLSSNGGTIDVAGNGVFQERSNSEFTGQITGTGSLTVTDSLGGGKVILGYNGEGGNTYTGGTVIDGNSNYGVRLQAGAENVLGTGRVSMSGAGDPQGYGAILNLNGFNQTIGSLEGDSFSNIRLVGAQLTTGGDNGDTTFAGTISDTAGPSAVSPGSLVKTGNGILTLSGANTYSGGTMINAGTLLANNTSGSATGTGEVTILSGAKLGGYGSIDGLATVASGGHLAPGNSPGTLTFTNGLTLMGGSILDFQLGTVSDRIDVTGGMLTGPSIGIITLNLSDAGGFSPGIPYTLFNFVSAQTDNPDVAFAVAAFNLGTRIGTTVALDYSFNLTPTSLTLTYTGTAIPEPSTYAALFGLAALGFAAYRRRHRRSV